MIEMQELNHPEIFWPTLERVIAGSTAESLTAREVSCFLERESQLQRLLMPTPDAPEPEDWKVICARVREMARTPHPGETQLAARVAALGARAGLGAVESALLVLATKLTHSAECRELADLMVGRLSWPRDKVLALMGGLDRQHVRAALGPKARLICTGLLEREIDPFDDSGHSIRFAISDRLRRALSFEGEIIDALVRRGNAPNTLWSDFDHIAPARDLALQTLRGALAQRAKGVNILLYGPPGTGKTQLCHLLAAQLGVELRMVCTEDEDGDEPARHERLHHLRLTQTLFRDAQDTLILFDEIEDLMPAFSPFLRREGSKVHQNTRFEENPVPILWTTNDISGIPASVRRRISFSIEMRPPAPAIRSRIMARLAATQESALPAATLDRLARQNPVAPAVLANALRTAGLSGGDVGAVEMALGASRRLVEGQTAPPQAPQASFDPDLVAADLDLRALTERLRKAGGQPVSLCLSGPSGTGKSAFARHLASEMGLEVLERRASDLLSMYVGGSERNIAEAFAEARDTRSFLIFDEADSLLGARANARHSWEVSQVNEMLTWMESHPLPFACTTNLPERLDPASLRRFALRIGFAPLRPEQAAQAFRRLLAAEPPAGLAQLQGLVPGDFACVARRRDWLDDPSPRGLLHELRQELAARGGPLRQIGFATH